MIQDLPGDDDHFDSDDNHKRDSDVNEGGKNGDYNDENIDADD